MRYFNFVLRDGMDDVVRKMNREQYKAHRHWLRHASWLTHRAINWDKLHRSVCDMMLYGSSVVNCADLVKA